MSLALAFAVSRRRVRRTDGARNTQPRAASASPGRARARDRRRMTPTTIDDYRRRRGARCRTARRDDDATHIDGVATHIVGDDGGTPRMSSSRMARRAATAATRRAMTTTTTTTTTTVPTLKANMTALVRLVHPDILASTHPELSRANAEALAHVQGTLDGVQKRASLPGAAVKRLRFYVRDEGATTTTTTTTTTTSIGVREVRFVLRTTGGDCRNVVAKDLGALFAAVGIERQFTWGERDWSTTRSDEEIEEERRRRREHGETSRSSAHVEDEVDEVPQAYRDPMPSNPSMRKKQAMDVHQALKQLDSAFEAIAACAWLTDADAERKKIVQFEVIPHLVSQGWVLKGETIEAIWRGERDETILLDGLDGGSSLAVLAVLRHAKNFERMYGAPM